MEKLNMHTVDKTSENFQKLAALFPNAVTETIDQEGNVVRAIDKDVLMQEISAQVVDGNQERYQFTWPDKRKSVVLANAPISKTLRLQKDKCVGKDGTPGGLDSENIYIEGDNLDALKLLQQTYLGKVKMIYIDPPYNTGNDFVYNDSFKQDVDEYADNSGQTDDEGNRLVQNTEGNGRFHTDWLNMIYPRLKIAKDLLSEDGVIFISIDDNEFENLKKCCNEIFGEENSLSTIAWRRQDGQTNIGTVARVKEYILIYCKEIKKVDYGTLPLSDKAKKDYQYKDERGFYGRGRLREPVRGRYNYEIVSPSGIICKGPWLIPENEFRKLEEQDLVHWPEKDGGSPRKKIYLKDMLKKGQISNDFWGIEYGTNQRGSLELENLFGKRFFDFPKPVSLINLLCKLGTGNDDSAIVMDFFSGSATTAHALMKLNAEDGGHRRFIMVQLPEKLSEESQAYNAGYRTICDIGEKRIQLAAKEINEAHNDVTLDGGYRCFYIDSSNMKDVYYSPSDYNQGQMELFSSNIKTDRTPDDLLMQVMIDLGVLLSSNIEETTIAGKKVFSVADGYLMACFDDVVTDDVVKAIAEKHPFYAVFRDSGMASDSVAANFEQIFETYSPNTIRKVL